jgi:hypothetical protein
MDETEAVAAQLASSCRSRSISGWPAPRRSARTRPRCCRISKPGGRWSSKPIVGAVVELGDRLGVPMPATQTVYACAKMLTRSAGGVDLKADRTLR